MTSQSNGSWVLNRPPSHQTTSPLSLAPPSLSIVKESAFPQTLNVKHTAAILLASSQSRCSLSHSSEFQLLLVLLPTSHGAAGAAGTEQLLREHSGRRSGHTAGGRRHTRRRVVAQETSCPSPLPSNLCHHSSRLRCDASKREEQQNEWLN